MKHYSIRNICIDYDDIRNEQYISKSKLKKVVCNFIYGQISTSMLDQMEKHNIKVIVYWHYSWWQPVVYIPQFCDYIDVLYQLGDDLGLYRYE